MNGAARAYGAWRIGARSENSEFDPSILPIRATTTQSAPFDRIENLIIATVNSPFQSARYKLSLESIRDSPPTIRAAPTQGIAYWPVDPTNSMLERNAWKIKYRPGTMNAENARCRQKAVLLKRSRAKMRLRNLIFP